MPQIIIEDSANKIESPNRRSFLISTVQLGILSCLGFSQIKAAAPRRPATETFLLECQIAGTSFRNLTAVEPHLQIGDVFTMRREPENTHDELAIAVHDRRENHLGYIPRKKNEVLNRLLDSGKLLEARLLEKETLPKVTDKQWFRLKISVFMKD